MIRPTLIVTLLCLAGGVACAADSDKERKAIAGMFPDVDVEDVVPSRLAGIYEVAVGPVILYVSADGRYVVRGEMFDTSTDENLTESRRKLARVETLHALSENGVIEFSPAEPKYSIVVFTDTSCTYCRQFHSEIDEYLKRGIRVEYAFFPRNGLASPNWEEMERVSCSADKALALTRAKNDQPFEGDVCADSPVMEHWQTGRMLGVRGTPAIFTENGTMIPGYLPPDRLLIELEKLRQETLAMKIE